MQRSTGDAVARQTRLGSRGLVAFLVLTNMFIPLSTDMYLPALPAMQENFQTTATLVNMTLSSFFFFYALGILFWGPLSDRFGRRSILLAGSTLYVLASLSCALAPGVQVMILARSLQGIGAGAITATAMAIVKDCYAGKKRLRILALVQSMAGLAPMLAPMLGALILRFSDWRSTFLVLSGLGCLCLVLTLLYRDTLPEEERVRGALAVSYSRMFVVARNRGFLATALIFACTSMAFMGYIANSSYIYVSSFGLSEQSYSYFFAANACLSLVAPWLYVRLLADRPKRGVAHGLFAVAFVAGLLVVLLGRRSPWLFLFCFMPFSLVNTMTRPFATNILLDQVKGDSGSASALINATFTVMGSIGMVLVGAGSGSLAAALGSWIVGLATLQTVAWLLLMRSRLPLYGVKDVAA